MSRVGKKPVVLPKGVDVKVDGHRITVKGPKGELKFEHADRVSVAVQDGTLVVSRADEAKVVKSLHGLTRNLIANMVHGVSEGFKRDLEILGVGYKAQVQGDKVIFALGYSHPIEFQLPAGIKAEVDKKQTALSITGIDKQLLGQVAANMRGLRPPDAYKGKGVRYAGEVIKLKAGKSSKK